MFTIHCERHGAAVLLGIRSIEAIENTDGGIVVHWRCPCGGRGELRTGLARRAVPA